ncbi:hypothetical protein PLICRDRAFT_114551 [Plicaturopsis crispa FD-325 SS-3]|nr:hypothetical protein PLICRDRAFT_114551 [Plicaturopsis crispa FD-325 SS-3]
MSLPPILYHYFPLPLPYTRTLALQERLHQIQLRRRPHNHKDILLLLQHRPVYTAGRRQSDAELEHERLRLTGIGADFVRTQRGGELTYHGPGQLVGYPLLDLARAPPTIGIRDYICRIQRTLQRHLLDAHALPHVPSEHTGVFLDAHTKIASIGVQVRHRLTTHGFALNVAREPQAWFDRVVACGLTDVSAGSVESATGRAVRVEDVVPGVVDVFGQVFGRRMERMRLEDEDEVGEAIAEVEEDARRAGDWLRRPSS